MNSCPHTHSPSPHMLAVERAGGLVVCSTCGGSVIECPTCQSWNRAAAMFCTACGGRLARPVHAARGLPAPGKIRDAISSAKPLSLQQGPAGNGDLTAFSWRLSPLGPLVFSHSGMSAPVRVSLISCDDPGEGRILTGDWPAAETWVSEPLISDHGIAVATADAVHTVAFHGYDSLGAVGVLRPEGGRVLALTDLGQGMGLALVASAKGALTACTGNGQSGTWAELWTSDTPVEHRGGGAAGTAWIATDGGTVREVVWLLAGGRFLAFDLADGSPALSLEVRDALHAPSSLYQRYKAGLFDPVMEASASGAPRLVLPIAGKAGVGVAIGNLTLRPGAVVRRVTDIAPTDWVVPHAPAEGILTGGTNALRCFRETESLWVCEQSDCDFPHPPAEGGQWLAAQAERRMAAAGNMQSQIIMLDLPGNGAARQAETRVIVRETVPGSPVPGLPPLLVDNRLLVALDHGRRDVKVLSIVV